MEEIFCDPGSNPPELVMPFLEDVAKLMAPGHPEAKIWFALQQYSPEKIEASYLAANLSWNSDYVLTVGRDDKAADLDGWASSPSQQAPE